MYSFASAALNVRLTCCVACLCDRRHITVTFVLCNLILHESFTFLTVGKSTSQGNSGWYRTSGNVGRDGACVCTSSMAGPTMTAVLTIPELLPNVLSSMLHCLCTLCSQELLLRYNRQGRKGQDLRSKCNTRTQKARNTGTNNCPTAPNASNNMTNYYSTSVLIGNLSPWQHLTACSPCQEVGTTTIHRPLTLEGALAVFHLIGCVKATLAFYVYPIQTKNRRH